ISVVFSTECSPAIRFLKYVQNKLGKKFFPYFSHAVPRGTGAFNYRSVYQYAVPGGTGTCYSSIFLPICRPWRDWYLLFIELSTTLPSLPALEPPTPPSVSHSAFPGGTGAFNSSIFLPICRPCRDWSLQPNNLFTNMPSLAGLEPSTHRSF